MLRIALTNQLKTPRS